MNVSAHRSIAQWKWSRPFDRHRPGPARPETAAEAPVRSRLAALVSQLTTGVSPNPGPEETPGPLDPYIRKALERTAVGSGIGTSLWRVDRRETSRDLGRDWRGSAGPRRRSNPQPLPPRPPSWPASSWNSPSA